VIDPAQGGARGPWSVILECPGMAPVLVSSHARQNRATEVMFAVAEQHKALRGTKVYVQSPDSADQLQRTQRGGVVRDQPSLPAIGEHVTVHVPTARRTRA
jgi:hypothetical protein